MTDLWDGIVIGGAGGAIAGLTVSLVGYASRIAKENIDQRRIYNWLRNNTRNENENAFRTTRTIASWTNLTEDRVRYICSIDERIYLSTGEKEDRWSLYEKRSRASHFS